MKNILYTLIAVVTMVCLSGCNMIENIFKGGFIFGIILAVIIGLIIWALSSFSNENLREDISKPVKS